MKIIRDATLQLRMVEKSGKMRKLFRSLGEHTRKQRALITQQSGAALARAPVWSDRSCLLASCRA